MFYAHSTDDERKSDWHLLRDHLFDTGEEAARFGAAFSAEKAARIAGLLHDLGKYTEAFQARLSGHLEKVDHATAGAVEIRKLAQHPKDKVAAELIAYAIAGHHAGLADWTGDAALSARLKKALEPLDPAWRDEIAPTTGGLMPDFCWINDRDKFAFQLGILGRMIFSCLVDADYRDTEAFYCQINGERRDREWKALGGIIDNMIATFDARMTAKHADANQSDVNRLRNDVLAHVRGQAEKSPGFFTLTVPTGGGKTLTSFGFALDHAKTHGLSRIIYAIPFTSVIDQTASVFREILGNDHILEHHSTIEEGKPKERERQDKLRLAMEDWAASIIVTTNVQLFESLFANRPSRCRKLHNIANSVIVLDEAQTIPLPLLRPCMEALRELAANYGCSIILCTATQPALGGPAFAGGLPLTQERELAPNPPELAERLKRTRINLAGDMDDNALLAELARTPQGLIIVNSRKHALTLYRQAKDAGVDGIIHLTTRQYAAHRQDILKDVRHRLKNEQPCHLIATSLVEAGVDLDFPRVWRAEAGLDQIAQAAGRCNREGNRPIDESIVTVFKSPDNPPPTEIKGLIGDFGRMRDNHQALLSPAALQDYFGEVYWRKGDGLDARRILGDFRLNGPEADFSYRTVAEKFRMIESGMAPVIIARDKAAKDALDKLGIDSVRPGGIARALQSFIVQVPPKARNLLLANGHARFDHEGKFGDQFCVLQTDRLYQLEVGLLWEDADYLGLEDSII